MRIIMFTTNEEPTKAHSLAESIQRIATVVKNDKGLRLSAVNSVAPLENTSDNRGRWIEANVKINVFIPYTEKADEPVKQ